MTYDARRVPALKTPWIACEQRGGDAPTGSLTVFVHGHSTAGGVDSRVR